MKTLNSVRLQSGIVPESCETDMKHLRNYILPVIVVGIVAALLGMRSVEMRKEAERKEPKTYAELAERLGLRIVAFDNGVELEKQPSVYMTSTNASFAELNRLRMDKPNQWEGTILVSKNTQGVVFIVPVQIFEPPIPQVAANVPE